VYLRIPFWSNIPTGLAEMKLWNSNLFDSVVFYTTPFRRSLFSISQLISFERRKFVFSVGGGGWSRNSSIRYNGIAPTV
jgi:hypothetical protein